MIAIDAKELWRQIPPEEKLELMALSHGKGVMAALINIIILCTIAVGLKLPWLIWTSLIMSPLIFQLAAGKAWRTLRPKIMLEHLAVRSAARRYAFSHRAKDLGLVTVFRGYVEETFDDSRMQEALEALEESVENNSGASAWIALFNDAVVALSECPGGASLKLAHLINKKLQVEAVSPDGKEYSNSHQVVLKCENNNGQIQTFKITSRYPAALIVFEKKLQGLLTEAGNRDDELDGENIATALPADSDTLFAMQSGE